MQCSRDRGARVPLLFGLASALVGVLIAESASVRADEGDGGKVVAIEEDWELIVKEPDEETQAPQVTCIIAPNNDDDGVFAAFNLNHKSYPQYDAGGLHLQLWRGTNPLQSAKHPSDELFDSPNEVVTWTTRMRLEDGQLWFEVVAGSSTTWGDFGSTGTLKVSVATDLENLNLYNRDASADNSGVGYAGNRVTALRLKAVRKLLHSGDVVEDNHTHTVYPHD